MICLGLSDEQSIGMSKVWKQLQHPGVLFYNPLLNNAVGVDEELLCFDVQVNATCPGNINTNASTQYLKAETCTVGI